MKAKKKRGPRGPYNKRGPAKAGRTKSTKQLQKVNLTFLNLGTARSRAVGVKVSKTVISMDGNTAKELGVKKGDYVVIGKDGNITYLALKPKGVIAGNQASQSPSGRISIQINSKHKLTPGVFSIGKKVEAEMVNPSGEPVPVYAYQLVIE